MKLLLQVYRRSPGIALAAALLGMVSGLASTGVVALINEMVADEVRQQHGLAYFGLCLIALLAKASSELWLVRVTQRAMRELRIDLSQKLLQNPLERLQALGKHRLLAVLNEDVATFGRSAEWLPFLLINGVIVLGCLGYLCWMSPRMFVGLCVLLGCLVLTFSLAERHALRALTGVREYKDRLYGHVRGLIEGTKELQLNARRAQQFVHERLAADARGVERLYIDGMTRYALAMNVGSSGFYAFIGVLMFAASWTHAEQRVLAGFCVTMLYMYRPISEALNTLPALRQAEIALDRIRGLEVELESTSTGERSASFASNGPLVLAARGLTHSYRRESDERAFTLGPIDLDVRAGELTFIVGGNGCGKTTLALLLLGLYRPHQGTITLNGQPVTDANRHDYRQHFSAVFADYHLFDDWAIEAEDDAVLSARASRYLEALQLQHKVQVRAGGPSTLALSTGQRKRLALLASYLEDRPVYLFDEWAADQDPAFRRVFYTQLLPELRARGKAVLVITHDDAYFDVADRVVKIDEGRIHELITRQRTAAPVVLSSV